MLNIAARAARTAGDIIVRHMDRVQGLEVTAKGYNDFVTEVDRQAEDAIIRTIHKAYPHHGILAEESGRQGDDAYQWIIDPLDGTTNYLHGFPQFAVSIALMHKGVLEQGVVYDPLRQELFTATRGSGALLNDRRIRVSRQTKLEGALLGTGFPFKDQKRLEVYLATFKSLFPTTSGIRRAGSAALDLAYVACGRFDGFWEFGLREWESRGKQCGFPQFAVSIALMHKGVLEQGVVYDPLRQELFTATRGSGALLNDRRIRVSRQTKLEGALLGTGFPFKDQKRLEVYLATFKSLFPTTSGIRRAGSAALDLAYVACGRFDGFWEFGLREWDMAAGVLLVQEAGGLVSDVNGGHDYLQSGHIAAGNPKIYKAILRTIEPHVAGLL